MLLCIACVGQLVVAGDPAHIDRLAVDYAGGHLVEVNVRRLTVGVVGAMVHYSFVIQSGGRSGGGKLGHDAQAHEFRPVGGLQAMDTRH